MSLRLRLLLTLGVGLALLITAGGVFLYLQVRDTLQEGFDEGLRSRAEALANRLELEIKPAFRKRITSLGAKAFAGGQGGDGLEEARAELLRLAEDGFALRFVESERTSPAYRREDAPDYYEILDADGLPIAKSPSLTSSLGSHQHGTQPGVSDLPLPDGRAGRAYVLRVDDIPFPQQAWTRAWEQIRGERPLASTTAYVRVARGIEEQQALLASLKAALVIAGLLLVLGTAGLVWFVSGRALAPLRRLRQQVEALEADSLDQRVALEGVPSELALVVRSLNASLERLERGFERERKTASHIAHELRTPIAELRSVTDVARQWPDDAELQARCVVQGQEIAEHMSRIISALMRVARAGTTPTLLSARLDLQTCVEGVWRRLEEHAATRNQALEADIPDALAIHTDPEVIETLLANLLRNAVDHAPRGSRIRVAGRATGDDEVTLTISNPCEDLQPEDMANVTDLFWQKDEARTSSLQGGLGLPLVSEVARSAGLGFELDLQDGLFHARLKLPRAEAATPEDEVDDLLQGELS